VYNILDGKAESDRVLYNDLDPESGFMLLPDLKWNQSQLESLYVTGLIRQPIQSLRELRASHLPLLRKLATIGKEVVRSKYGIHPCQLRVYFHYQPTYYHLHVHYTHLCYQDLGSVPERAHLVEDVIDNIERDPEFYAKCNLTFLAKELDLLTEEYKRLKPEYFQ
jgi:m7GpppX diphosphatase